MQSWMVWLKFIIFSFLFDFATVLHHTKFPNCMKLTSKALAEQCITFFELRDWYLKEFSNSFCLDTIKSSEKVELTGLALNE